MKHTKTVAAKTLLLNLNNEQNPRSPLFTRVSGILFFLVMLIVLIF